MRKSDTGEIAKDKLILSEAVRIFREKGYHATSVQDIADAVGLQKGSLYHYISSKEELLYKIFEKSTGALTVQLKEIVNSDSSPTDKLRQAIQAHIVALCDELDTFTVYIAERRTLAGRIQNRVRAEAERHARLLQEILQEGIARGEFREVDSKVTTNAILGMCNWLHQWYSPTGRLSPEQIADLYSDLIVGGLALHPKRR